MTYTVSSTPSKSPKGYHSKRQLQPSTQLMTLNYPITPFNPGLGCLSIFYSAICLGRSCHPVNQSHERLKPHSPLPVLRAVCLLFFLVLCALSGLAVLITLVLWYESQSNFALHEMFYAACFSCISFYPFRACGFVSFAVTLVVVDILDLMRKG